MQSTNAITPVAILLILIVGCTVLASLAYLYRQNRRLKALLQAQPQAASALAETVPSPAVAEASPAVSAPADSPLVSESPPPLPVAPPVVAESEHTPPILSVCGLAGGSARSTTAVELARGLSEEGLSVLLVDASPFHTAALLLGLPGPEPETVQNINASLRYVWLRQPTLARLRQLSLAENPQQVILNLPLEHSEQNTALLSASQALLLTLPLRPRVLKQLARHVQYLHGVLSAHLPEWFAVLPVRYQADNPLQAKLLETLRAEYPQLILPMAVPETPAVHQALLSQPADLQPYQAAYQAMITRLKDSRLARL